MSAVEFVGDVVLFSATGGAVLSVAMYAPAPWYRQATGVHVMSYMAVVAAVLLLVTVRNIIGPFPLYEFLRLLVWVFGAIVIWWRAFIIWRARRADRAYAREVRDNERY